MRSDGTLRAGTDGSPAVWIAEAIRPFRDYTVGSLVPPVFEAYARILHPAWLHDPTAMERIPVRWATVAAWSGGTVHSLAQFGPMARERGRPSTPSPFDTQPDTGELEPSTLTALCEVLAPHTMTADRCAFGLWEGHGWLTPAAREATAHFDLPERNYLLFEGPLTGVGDVGWLWGEDFESESPNLIWPSDRRWLVASAIDLDSTFVGGSRELIEELLHDPRFEAWPAGPADRVTFDSDPINGVVRGIRED